jgi:hypothetical protein
MINHLHQELACSVRSLQKVRTLGIFNATREKARQHITELYDFQSDTEFSTLASRLNTGV